MGVWGARRGGGSVGFLLKIQGGGGFGERGGGWAEGLWGCLRGIWAGGLNIFFRGRNAHQVIFARIHAGPAFALARIQENIVEEVFPEYFAKFLWGLTRCEYMPRLYSHPREYRKIFLANYFYAFRPICRLHFCCLLVWLPIPDFLCIERIKVVLLSGLGSLPSSPFLSFFSIQRTTNPLWNQTPHETTLLLHLVGTSLARNLDSCCSWKSPQRWRCFMSGVFRVGWHCGGNLWTQFNEGPRSRCFTLGLWFHVGFRADLVMFFHVVSCRVYVWDAWCIEIHCFENGKTPQVSLRSQPWRGLSKVRCFMSGWGFVSGLRVPNQCLCWFWLCVQGVGFRCI